MSRREKFNAGSGWSFPVDPASVVDRTMQGGYTVDLKTGLEPTTGTMVSIPGHEKPIPTSELTPSAVVDYGEAPENKTLLVSPDLYLGTWRSDADKAIGDAGYLDISKNYPDTPEGGRAARRAAMEGSQWGLYNIDRGMTEHNIANPNVVENIRAERKIDIPENEIKDYLESDQPVGHHIAFGYLTEPSVYRTPSGRKKVEAPAGQMTFFETGEKPNYD